MLENYITTYTITVKIMFYNEYVCHWFVFGRLDLYAMLTKLKYSIQILIYLNICQLECFINKRTTIPQHRSYAFITQ